MNQDSLQWMDPRKIEDCGYRSVAQVLLHVREEDVAIRYGFLHDVSRA